MFDIGAFELFLIGIVALVVIGPEELPKFLRSAGQLFGKAREIAGEFRQSVRDVIDEAENFVDDAARDVGIDPFAEERRQEGVTKDMSPEEITKKIMGRKAQDKKADDKDGEGA